MKFRAYAVLILAILVSTGLAFTLRGDAAVTAGSMAAMFVLATLFSAALNSKAGFDFVERNPETVRRIGYAVVVLGMLALAGSFVLTVQTPSSGTGLASNMASVMFMLAGVLIVSAPKIARQTQAGKARQAAFEKAKAEGAQAGDFDGVQRGLGALRSVVSDWHVFLKIAGPWMLLPVVGMGIIAAWGGKSNLDKTVAEQLVLLFLAVILVAGMGLATVAVAWSRWRLSGVLPPYIVALPDGPTWSVIWRIWIFVGVYNRGSDWISTKVTQLAASAGLPFATLAGDLAGLAVLIAALMLFSSFGLRVPAFAVRDKEFDQTIAATEGRRLWPGLPVGLVIAVSPFIIFDFATDMANELAPKAHPVGTPTMIEAVLVAALAILILFFAAAAAASFLADAYREAKLRLQRLSLS